MSTPGGEQIGEAHIEVDMDTDPAMRALREFSRDANGRLHDLRGRFVAEGQQISRSLENSTRESDRFGLSLRGLTVSMGPLAGVLGRISLGIGAIGAAAGTALPLIASVVTAVESIAPAGAVAATGLLAVQQATQTVKLGMIGVQDAVTAAFDTSAKGTEKFQKALDKLAPSAREFALTVRDLAPAFTDFQQSIQQELFTGFSDELKSLSTSVLPVLKTNLSATAVTLNAMALSTAQAASQLATDGTLGKAMAGANAGLKNLSGIPAQVTTGLGQLAAAASPAFDRITTAAAQAATTISGKLSDAFKSGALEDSVNAAVDVLAGLGEIAGNVFGTLKNVLGAASTGGKGLFSVLTSVTQALETATGTQGFQDAIKALVQTMSVVADTVGPLLGQAIAALGPVFTSLAVPVQILVRTLGDSLGTIIAALGPALASTATAVGSFAIAIAPLLPVVADLVAALLPVLASILDQVGAAFSQSAPLIQQVVDALSAGLGPILANLPSLVGPLLDAFGTLVTTLLPVLSDLVTQLSPVFTAFVTAIAGVQTQLVGLVVQLLPVLANLLVQLAPSIIQLVSAFIQLETALFPVISLVLQLITSIVPILTPVISLFSSLAAVLATVLAGAITNVVIPVINTLVALFSGDLSGAATALGALFSGIGAQISSVFTATVNVIRAGVGIVSSLFQFLMARGAALAGALSGYWNTIASTATAAFGRLRTSVSSTMDSVTALVRSLPGRVTAALGNLSTTLYNAGRSLIQGFVNGIRSMIGAAADAASSVVGEARSFFGSSPAKQGPLSGKGWTLYSGEAFATDFAAGIRSNQRLVSDAAKGLVGRAATPVATGSNVSSLLTTARASGSAVLAATPNVNVSTAAPNVTVVLGNKVIDDHIQVLIDANNAAVARQLAQGVRR